MRHANGRITPAHAGTRYIATRCGRSDADHPRTRGDKEICVAEVYLTEGSPPHTRGQVPSVLLSEYIYRITPAHAGTRLRSANPVALAADHPRTRGDKSRKRDCSMALAGSPPHTRGQAEGIFRNKIMQRITPAHAGTRLCQSAATARQKDHPRTRGDKSFRMPGCTCTRGSPPHTRGQVILDGKKKPVYRITPAHAGTSTS